MNKAMQLSKKLEKLNIADGMKVITASSDEALHFDVINDCMCIMHDDGSGPLAKVISSRIPKESIS